MKLKPIIRLIITPLSLLLLLSSWHESYGMNSVTGRKTGGKGAKKAPAATTVLASGAAEALATPLPTESLDLGSAVTAEAPQAIAAPAAVPEILSGQRSYAEVVADDVGVPRLTIKAPTAVYPDVAPALSPRPASPVLPAAAAAPSAIPTAPKIIVDTDALPMATRFVGALYHVAGWPEDYKTIDSEGNTHIRLGRLQRAIAGNSQSAKESDVAGAVAMLQEASNHDISIGASFADAAFTNLQKSSDLRCVELEAQIARLEGKLLTSAATDIDSCMIMLGTLAEQIKLRKEGRNLATDRATNAGSKITRSTSPVADYTPGDNSAAKAELMAAIETYVTKTAACFVPRIKAAVRLSTASPSADGSGSGFGGSTSDKH